MGDMGGGRGYLVSIACFQGDDWKRQKKGRQLFGEEKCTPQTITAPLMPILQYVYHGYATDANVIFSINTTEQS